MAADSPAMSPGGSTGAAKPWALVAVLAVYFHVFMEWLFFVTKPSFLSPLGLGAQVGAFFATAALLALPAAIVPLLLGAFARLSPLRVPEGWLAALGWAVPAAVLAACLFQLIDNFSYTVMGFGVLTTAGPVRWLYAVLFAVLFFGVLRKLLRLELSQATLRLLRRAAAVLLLVSLAVLVAQYLGSVGAANALSADGQRAERMPNILMLASDGVEASHMSAYGAERETTPFIASLFDRALVVENAYPNATATAGSVVSMLTSKLPTHTRLYQYQNILTGRDSYEHLPGILRDIGYRSIHVSILLFADPSGLPRPWNMWNAFDDYERVGSPPPGLALAYSTDAYFMAQVVDRVAERLRHAVGVGREQRKFAQMLSAGGTTDAQRIDAVLDFMEASDRPTFAHLHLMDTHEPFRTSEEFFSGGATESEQETDLYDNSVRTFDGHVAAIIGRLRDSGRLENTIVVLSSDHGRDWVFSRVPLLFLFPGGEHRGVIRSNVSMLDVAPTLLDHLGLPVPEWMEGQSLIAGEPDPLRSIQTVRVVTDAGPPFPQMGRIGITTCNRTVWLMPRSTRVKVEWVDGHTAPCDSALLPPPGAVRAMIVSDLARSGYDVSRLRLAPRGGRRAKPDG